MSAILIALLALAAIAIAVYPLFKTMPRIQVSSGLDPNLENLLSQREATYSAIKDLEFDHAQGKISDADYAVMRDKYENKALGILQQLQVQNESTAPVDEHPLHLPNNGCPHCGEPVTWDDKFCRSCGGAIGATCRACGTPVAPESKFCATCGAAIATLQPAAQPA